MRRELCVLYIDSRICRANNSNANLGTGKPCIRLGCARFAGLQGVMSVSNGWAVRGGVRWRALSGTAA